MLVSTPGLAPASPGTDPIAALIAEVAKANQRLEDLSAAVEMEQESVNKAMVAVETARDEATAAEHELEISQQAVKDANAAISAAQHRFDSFAAATYMNGPSDGYLTAKSPTTSSPPQPRRGDDRQHPDGDGQPAAGPNRTSEQGIGGPAGQAEGRQGRCRGESKPGRGGGRPHRHPAQVRRTARGGQSPGRRA
ncbi:cell wall-associated hydrolase domain protein [Mycobacterium kansasii]|uniref:Cell wall-associated hydrolase domain protein n=1 Tax=Mycobacterium kansasii TaxID=1768 RepID=A0A1V3WI16_MYCKA|nr:cell wall-associated hydrolase domain protein [Mycobacterium kansasii]